jgi:hypothetical protein
MKLARIALNPDANRILMMQVPDDRTPAELFLAARNDGALWGNDFVVTFPAIHHIVVLSIDTATQPQWGVPMTLPQGKAN